GKPAWSKCATTHNGGSISCVRNHWPNSTIGWAGIAICGSSGWMPCIPRLPEENAAAGREQQMATNASPGTRIVGTLRRLGDGKGAVRMEGVYATDVDDLWSALTEPARLARWIAEVRGELQVGGQIQARFTSSWEGPGRIDVCE